MASKAAKQGMKKKSKQNKNPKKAASPKKTRANTSKKALKASKKERVISAIKPVLGPYQPLELEPQILEFWKKNKIYEKSKEKNKKGKKFTFLQGPPYTSGRIHLGHAWNGALKDMAVRYKRMRGFNVWDRNGYDVHGLPIEHKAQDNLKLKFKEDIEKFGIEKFNAECRKIALEFAGMMDKDFQRVGLWLDYQDPYMPLSNGYMEGQWWFIKKAYDNGRVYEGEKTVTWCKECSTALAKHELEYKNVEETSIFVKLKVKGKDNEYLVIWTTTPWTIPFNLAVMVSPELEYVKCRVDGECLIVAKALAAPFIQAVMNKNLEIIEEFMGADLEGIEYIHPFQDQIADYKELKKESQKVHTVIMSSEYVDTTAGTGLVHCAPGCGPEDYEVGHKNGIPPYNTISETGEFPESMGEFKGLVAKKDDEKFIKALADRGALIETSPVEHDYAHCWRCHNPVVFRTTKQWFLRSEDLIGKITENNKKVHWVPKEASEQFDLWIKNLRDNSITRQRYWGTPVPIWRCECGSIEVIGSAAELKKKSGKAPKDLHKPFIDEVEIECGCGKKMRRIPDVLDVWLDSGSASWNCFYYPEKKEIFKERFPADLVLEAKEQIRLWFYMLSLNSEIAFNENAYKNAYCTGMLLSVEGEKMSKSLGNIISPYEIIDRHGADAMRYYVSSIRAGLNVSFSWDEIKIKQKNLGVLWNVHKFLIDLAKTIRKNPAELVLKKVENSFSDEEQYMLSKLNSTIRKATLLLDEYRLDEAVMPIEELYLELSRTYIQIIRDKASLGSESEKDAVLYTIYNSIMGVIKMLNIACPFICEQMYQNLKAEFGLKEASINLSEWPAYSEELIFEEVEKSMETAQSIIQGILSAREKAGAGVRWPLRDAVVISQKEEVLKAVDDMEELIKRQANIKDIIVMKKFEGLRQELKPNFREIANDFGSEVPKIVARLSVESHQSILQHIENEGKFDMLVDGGKFEIKEKHLTVEKRVEEPYVMAELKGMIIALNKDMNKELEGEGFAREITRRVQMLRKEAGLEKKDSIELYINVDKELEEMLEKHEDMMREKVGAAEIEISSEQEYGKEKSYHKREKIKQKEVSIWFDLV